MVDEWFGISAALWSGLIATLTVAALYAAAALTRRRGGGEDPISRGHWLSPLVVTAGVFGRGSLTNLQLFWFTLVVFWVLAFLVCRSGSLSALSPDVLAVFGTVAAGSAAATLAAVTRKRLSFENWSWLRDKGWIMQDIGKPRRPPRFADLLTDDDRFDVAKFQTFLVGLAVGAILLLHAVRATGTAGVAETADPVAIEIPATLLGLLGLSQAVNVAAKAIRPSPIAELDRQLTRLQRAEAVFIARASEHLAGQPSDRQDMAAARQAAKPEYEAYIRMAKQTARMVQERIGAPTPPCNLDPDMPTVLSPRPLLAA